MPRRNVDISQDNTPGFAFIAAPIQSLFEGEPGLAGILQALSVLAIRFRRTYLHAPRIDWRQPFDVDMFFFQHLFNATSADDFAHSLTSIDEAAFATLTPENIIADDTIAQQYLARWETLAISVYECASALPNLIEFIHACVQVSPTSAHPRS